MSTIRKSGGIGIYYTWEFQDDTSFCGHAHRTFEAAEKCAVKTIRAARRGEKFAYSGDFATMIDAEACGMVHKKTYSL